MKVDTLLDEYIAVHTTPETPLLQQLTRETYAKVLMPRMISGHLQGRVLSMITHMMRPARVLEIGTFTGYSTLCLAEGLPEGGLLHTIDINEELEDMVRNYIQKAGFQDKIIQHIGAAAGIIPTLTDAFDLVFIDADKVNNGLYYDLVFDKVKQGGFIIIDNVLWNGKVAGEPDRKIDKDTQRILDFNKKVIEDIRVESVMLPIRDGLTVVRKL